MWKSLHNIARSYTPSPENAAALKQYMDSLATLFPCQKCSRHIREAVANMPTNSKYDVFKWFIDFHNSVNERIGKKVLSYEQAVEAIMDCRGGPPLDPPGMFAWNGTSWILILVIVACVVVMGIIGTRLYIVSRVKSVP